MSQNKGIFTEYIERKFSATELAQERKKQLAKIAKIRRRDVFVYAADIKKHRPPYASATIDDDDLMPVADQLSVLDGRGLDVILETQGGKAEAAEDIVKQIRHRFKSVGFIIPGRAKSAGTIMVMSGDEILMEPASALGPIDAQMSWAGKTFSADAFLTGLDNIKKEVAEDGLNRAFIPILQNISPGEIEACRNAQNFSRKLVSEWLIKYKFSQWTKHSSTGEPVTSKERSERAIAVAEALCNHNKWLTHGRSLKIDDLRQMGLEIVDYAQQDELCDAIRRYYALLRVTFDSTAIYKLFETPVSQIQRQIVIGQAGRVGGAAHGNAIADIEVECPNCHTRTKLQANFGAAAKIKPGFILFPPDNCFRCPSCKAEQDLVEVRRNLETQTKLRIV